MRNRHPMSMAILLLLFFSFLLAPSSALTHDVYIHSSSTEPILTITDFAFTHSGHIDLSLSLFPPNPNPNSALSFFLTPKSSKTPTCPLLPSNLTLSFPSPTTNASLSFHITPPQGEFTFSFANCPPNPPISLTFHLRYSMYNLDSHGLPQYLPVGITPLPTVFFIASLVYFAVVITWFLILRKTTVSTFYWFVLAALIVRAVMLLSEAENHSFQNNTGRGSHGFGPIFCITVLGRVWSAILPHPIHLCRVPLDMGSMIPLLPMIFIFMDLNKKIKKTAQTDERLDFTLRRLRLLFIKCCAFVICYMYLFSGVVVCTLQMSISYHYRWIISVVVECLNLAFYVFIGCKFNPTLRSLVAGCCKVNPRKLSNESSKMEIVIF